MEEILSKATELVSKYGPLVSLVTVIISGLFALAAFIFSQVLGLRVQELKERIDEQQAVSGSLGVLKDEKSPVYVKALALSSLLKREFVEPDVIFSAAYSAENTHGTGILRDIFYEHAESGKPMKSPFGYVDLNVAKVDKEAITIEGWALDLNDKVEVWVWLDHERLDGKHISVKGERRDVADLFKRYPNAIVSAFTIKLPRTEYKPGNHRLRVRLANAASRYMEILDAQVLIWDRGVRIVPPDNWSKP